MQLKHYRLKSESDFEEPALMFQVKLDLCDVRSGYRGTDGLCLKADWLPKWDLNWSREMVEIIDSEGLEEIFEPSPVEWPQESEERIAEYLLRHYRTPIWRNRDLGLYSQPGETPAEFEARCREAIEDERWEELSRLHRMVWRRFFELERKFLEALDADEQSKEEWRDKCRIQIRDTFLNVREQLSRCCLTCDPTVLASLNLAEGTEDLELQERLEDLKEEFVHACLEITNIFERRITQIERYEVSPTYPSIEITSRGIVWD